MSLEVTRCGSPGPFHFPSPLPPCPLPVLSSLDRAFSTIFKQVAGWLSYFKCNINKTTKKTRKEQKRKIGREKSFSIPGPTFLCSPSFQASRQSCFQLSPLSSALPSSTPLIQSCIHRNPHHASGELPSLSRQWSMTSLLNPRNTL